MSYGTSCASARRLAATLVVEGVDDVPVAAAQLERSRPRRRVSRDGRPEHGAAARYGDDPGRRRSWVRRPALGDGDAHRRRPGGDRGRPKARRRRGARPPHTGTHDPRRPRGRYRRPDVRPRVSPSNVERTGPMSMPPPVTVTEGKPFVLDDKAFLSISGVELNCVANKITLKPDTTVVTSTTLDVGRGLTTRARPNGRCRSSSISHSSRMGRTTSSRRRSSPACPSRTCCRFHDGEPAVGNPEFAGMLIPQAFDIVDSEASALVEVDFTWGCTGEPTEDVGTGPQPIGTASAAAVEGLAARISTSSKSSTPAAAQRRPPRSGEKSGRRRRDRRRGAAARPREDGRHGRRRSSSRSRRPAVRRPNPCYVKARRRGRASTSRTRITPTRCASSALRRAPRSPRAVRRTAVPGGSNSAETVEAAATPSPLASS